MRGVGDALPICITKEFHLLKEDVRELNKLFQRALNKNQILILSHINRGFSSLTSLLNFLSQKFNKPLSTLKLNAKILKELKLIDYGSSTRPKGIKLTELGKFVLGVLSYDGGEFVFKQRDYSKIDLERNNSSQRFIEANYQKTVLYHSQNREQESSLERETEVGTLKRVAQKVSVLSKSYSGMADIEVFLRRIEERSKDLKAKTIEFLREVNNFHLDSSLSVIDILLVLFTKWFLIDKSSLEDNVLILSKGHSAPAFYMMLTEFGLIRVDELRDFGKLGSRLTTHVQKGLPLVKVSSGSLGQGLSIANGVALASRMNGKKLNVYVILGDGELDEGQIWEAATTASHYKLDNVIVIIDRNGKQLNGNTEMIKSKEPLNRKWKSFGWQVFEVEGHDYYKLLNAIIEAEKTQGHPKVIIANTSGGGRNEFN